MLHAGLETVLSLLRQNLWLTKEDVRSNVSSGDVCLARDSESDLANRTWDHYPRKECQRPYQLYTLVLTLHDPYRQKCQVSRKHTNVCSRVHRHVWVTWSLQKAK